MQRKRSLQELYAVRAQQQAAVGGEVASGLKETTTTTYLPDGSVRVVTVREAPPPLTAEEEKDCCIHARRGYVCATLFPGAVGSWCPVCLQRHLFPERGRPCCLPPPCAPAAPPPPCCLPPPCFPPVSDADW